MLRTRDTTLRERVDSTIGYHYQRERLNALFAEAVSRPLVVVCAGAGYGKTSAIHDFAREYGAVTAWVQLSERDNVGARFWENYTHTIAQMNKPFAMAMAELGFPDTEDKLNQYQAIMRENVVIRKRLLVFDDFHLIEDPAVLHFIERSVHDMIPEMSLFLVSRTMPRINIASMTTTGRMFSITESDLQFTEQELVDYFRKHRIPLPSDSLRTIMGDTEGWAFAINLIARSYRQAPGYEGYLRNAMKTNIFQLMESEIWNGISDKLQDFLVRLSLIGHLAVDLIALLADGDDSLMDELERQSAYVRRDDYISAYLIHHLFLEFLTNKQSQLTEQQKIDTYQIAASWCNDNGFKIDAMSYYEKVGNYAAIILIFFDLPTQVPQDVARFAVEIFKRAPADAYDRVDFFAVMHVRVVMCLGLWREAFALMAHYEARYLKLPEDDDFRNHVLGGIYYCWAILRTLMCTIDDCYDFDEYYAKMDECLSRSPVEPGLLSNHPSGPWISLVGTSRAGAPQEYIDSLTRATAHASHCFGGAMSGIDDLAQGELKFYQGNITGAEADIVRGLERAREHRQHETVHRALFYILRISIFQGDRLKAEQALKDMKTLLNEHEYAFRYITYDIAEAWYSYILEMPDRVPEWLTENFAPYGHAYFIENFGNQAKARYCFMAKKYPMLLSYLDEQKKRESILFGRLEMLAMEACVHYRMKNKAEAFAVLHKAYEEAVSNGLVTPFVLLGKDMRTLTASALKEPDIAIPREWLEDVNSRAATYAKRRAHIIADYKQANRIEDGVAFSQRESEILTDLSHGLSRKEIALNHNLSVNTVKMIINAIYGKLGAENLADLIRIATEQKII